MKWTPLILATVLAGCATSSEKLGQSKVEDTYHSSKTPADVANCITNRLNGNAPSQQATDGHWIVTRTNNMYGVPVARWDIYDTGSGSRIEFRRSFGIMSGEEKAATCF